MKKLFTILLLSASVKVSAQTTKPDTAYKLTEPQIIQISQLLDYGLKAAGNSAQISTKDYNIFARQVMQVDSVFKSQYAKLHPVKAEQKKEGKQ